MVTKQFKGSHRFFGYYVIAHMTYVTFASNINRKKFSHILHSDIHLSFVLLDRAKAAVFPKPIQLPEHFQKSTLSIPSKRTAVDPELLSLNPSPCFTTDWVTCNRSMQPDLLLRTSTMERVDLFPHHLQLTGNS